MYQSAEQYLKEHLKEDKTLKLKTWKEEIEHLTSQKNSLYEEVRKLKMEVQEAEAVKKCVEQVLQAGHEKEQIKQKNIEL